jgi:hypothetical protein
MRHVLGGVRVRADISDNAHLHLNLNHTRPAWMAGLLGNEAAARHPGLATLPRSALSRGYDEGHSDGYDEAYEAACYDLDLACW